MKKILLIAGVISMVGCKKFLDVNTNPNTATVTKANFVFANALNRSAAYMAGGPHITSGHWSGYYGHSTSFTGGGQEKTYVFTNADFNYFDAVYDNLADYQYVIEHAVADGVGYMVGPAKLMQCFMMQKLVDFYGDVPYSTSKGAGGTYSLTPSYDGAASIYTALTAKITEAVNDMNGTPNAATGNFPTSDPSDIFMNGNKTNWKKFANTVKLRMIIRRSNVAGYNAAADIATISSDGFITAHVLSNPGYLKTSGKLNPYYQNFGFNENDAPTGDFRKMGQPIVDFLKNSNDIFRLSRKCSAKADPANAQFSTNPADYAGVPLGGAGNPYLSSNVSAMGREQIKLGEATRPMVIMSDAEATFLQAEAIQRGWLPGNAQAMYEQGVRLAFRLSATTHIAASATATTAVADATANTYLVNGNVNCDWSVATDKLKLIWVQKWVALCNFDGEEAWAEYRRTTSPTNPNGNLPLPATQYSAHSVAVGGPEPVRLFYPQRESNVNSTNVPTGVTQFSPRIFWDIN